MGRGQVPQSRGLQIVPQAQDAAGGFLVGEAPVIVHDCHQRLQAAGLGIVRHGDAPAGGDIQKAQAVQLPQALMDHGLADVHGVGQLPLRGQPVPGLQLPGQDGSLHLLDKQLPNGRGHNGTEIHGISSFWSDQDHKNRIP